jgi:hypothetical protein
MAPMKEMLKLFRWGLLLVVNPKAAIREVNRSVDAGNLS